MVGRTMKLHELARHKNFGYSRGVGRIDSHADVFGRLDTLPATIHPTEE